MSLSCVEGLYLDYVNCSLSLLSAFLKPACDFFAASDGDRSCLGDVSYVALINTFSKFAKELEETVSPLRADVGVYADVDLHVFGLMRWIGGRRLW